jgi:hypothetical protein
MEDREGQTDKETRVVGGRAVAIFEVKMADLCKDQTGFPQTPLSPVKP